MRGTAVQPDESVVAPVVRWLTENVEFSDIIAACAVVVSILALAYSVRSANGARDAARVAEAVRHRDDQPRMEWALGPIEDDECLLRVTMRAGPAIVRIDLLSYVAELLYLDDVDTPPVIARVDDYLPLYEDSRLFVRERTHTFVLTGMRSVASISAVLMMTCTDFYENRSWYIVEHALWSADNVQ